MKRTLLIITLTVLLPVMSAAQGTAFSFQGRLNDGTTPANGSYDLQFSLYSAIVGGSPIGTIPRPNTTLINGVFSVTLDFGATAFNNPNAVFIEIAVRPNGSPNAFTILGPRQQLTVVPFAVRAANATNADNATNAVNAQNATNAGTALNSANSSLLESLTARDFIRNSTTTMPNSNFNISNNGVINGTLNVVGTTTIGSPTITSNLNISGSTTSAGNIAQNRDKGGVVKAMIFVNPNGTIARCYNSITGSSTGNCGFIVEPPGGFPGFYYIEFEFQVNDRFISVTPVNSGDVNIVASFSLFTNSFPNRLFVSTNITDVDKVDSYANNAFMVIVY